MLKYLSKWNTSLNNYLPYYYSLNPYINKISRKFTKITKVNKKLNIKKSDTISENKEEEEGNIYLKIYSCLNKLKLLDANDPLRERVNSYLKNNNISLEDYSHEDISKLISNDKKNEDEAKLFLEKIVKEELSEEEFADKNQKQIRFIRPPHNINELKNLFKDVEKIYEENKKYLFFNDSKIIDEERKNFIEKIPTFFQMRSLIYPETESEIFLMGVQRNSNIHALYLADLIRNYKPDMLAVLLQPDLPLFLKSEGDYKEQWNGYVTGRKDAGFMVSTLPKSINEIIISPRKIEQLVDETFVHSDHISISPKIVYSSQKHLNLRNAERNFADSFLTPFIYSFQRRVDEPSPIAICDMPLLKQMEDIVYSNHIDVLKDVLNRCIDELSIKNYGFSMESFYPKIFLSQTNKEVKGIKRLDYVAEALRHMCYSSKKIVLVIPYQYMDCMIESWKNLSSSIKNLNSFYRENNEEIYFIDYIEKLVIVDLLHGSFIHNHFIKNNTFPYPPRKDIESFKAMWSGVISAWIYYYNHYSSLLSEIPYDDDKYNAYLKKFNLGDEDQVDSLIEESDIKQQMIDEINRH